MKINKLKKLTKGRYKITFDNNDSLILYEEVILKHNVLIKKEVDAKALDSILKDNYYSTIYNDALRYINIRIRSEKELKELLIKKFPDEETINKVIEELLKEGYINDVSFCKSYVNDKLYLSNDGLDKIKDMLSYYDMDNKIIDEVISGIDKNVIEEKLNKLMEKYIRINNKYSSSQLKSKVLNYFINLGFNKEMILEIYDTFDIRQDNKIIEKEYERLHTKYSKKYSGYKLNTYIKSRLYQKGFSYEEIDKLETEE
jgi:regulatory protein